MKTILKKSVAIFAFMLLGGTASAQIVFGSKFKGFSYDEMITPLLQQQQAYNQAMELIDNLYRFITNALGSDIDNQLRQEMNHELSLLGEVANHLYETGDIRSARINCSIIHQNVMKEMANYNNRVAQERERQSQQEAEERAKAQNWSGTGFALKEGYIATNYHVIDDAKSITIQGINGDFNRSYTATVVGSDKINDLALLKISDPSFQGFGTIPYSIATTTAEVGEDIFVLGYPLTSTMGDEIKLTTGIISSKTGFQGDVALYQISAPIQPGNSGGPLFDKKGNIIGVVSAKHAGAENVGYAIKSNYLRNLIESCASTSIIPTSNTVSTLPLTNKVKLEKNFVFFIHCLANNDSVLSSAENRDSVANNDSVISSAENHNSVENNDSVLSSTENYNSIENNNNTRVIMFPTISTNRNKRLQLNKVTLTPTETILDFSVKNRTITIGNGWFNMSPQAHIIANGERFLLRRADGVALAPGTTSFSSSGETRRFRLIFPPIPFETTSIDFIESSDSKWKLYGIDISQ